MSRRVMVSVAGVAVLSYLLGMSGPAAAGPVLIPVDESIGIWDEDTRVYTLTTDYTVADSSSNILVTQGNLTLDGAGYTITGLPGCRSVCVTGQSGVVVRDVTFVGAEGATGVRLYSGANNCTVEDNRFSGPHFGVDILDCDGCVVRDNEFNVVKCAINVHFSSDCSATGNTFHGDGTWGNSTFALHSWTSPGLEIVGNTTSGYGQTAYIADCDGATIEGNTHAEGLPNAAAVEMIACADCDVVANTLSSSGTGVALRGTSSCTVTDNVISYNIRGLDLAAYGAVGSDNNTICNNNIIGNAHQARVTAGTGNKFNLDWPTCGNYWSNWTGPDLDGDFIVDYPYIFEGGQDDLPWAVPSGWMDPSQLIKALIAHVGDLGLPAGTQESLVAKLNAALNALDDANENNDVAAINALEAFINAVEAQSGKKIEDTDAEALIVKAQHIAMLLMGGF